MYYKDAVIINSSGLQARPAAEFAAKAKTFKSVIRIQNLNEKNPVPVNAKSIVMILAEGLGKGCRVRISAEGEDEREAAEELAALISGGFGELSAGSDRSDNE